LDDYSVDLVVLLTLASSYIEESIVGFIQDFERIVREGGHVLTVNIAPS